MLALLLPQPVPPALQQQQPQKHPQLILVPDQVHTGTGNRISQQRLLISQRRAHHQLQWQVKMLALPLPQPVPPALQQQQQQKLPQLILVPDPVHTGTGNRTKARVVLFQTPKVGVTNHQHQNVDQATVSVGRVLLLPSQKPGQVHIEAGSRTSILAETVWQIDDS